MTHLRLYHHISRLQNNIVDVCSYEIFSDGWQRGLLSSRDCMKVENLSASASKPKKEESKPEAKSNININDRKDKSSLLISNTFCFIEKFSS